MSLDRCEHLQRWRIIVEDQNNEQAVNELLFVHLVTMFQVAAMQQMGKVQNPLTQKIERDLEQAKFSIDMLGMLKERTKGNLSNTEEQFLGKALFELQMNYVDEVDRAKKEGEKSKDDQVEAQPGGGAEAAGMQDEAPKEEDEGGKKGTSKPRAKGKKGASKKKKKTKREDSS